jgi:Family of unknown function (DUF6402)
MSSITPLDIAQAMKKMGWPVASSLMKRWAVGAAWTMPDTIKLGTADPMQLPANQFDDTIVTMSWLLKFKRAKTAYDEVISKAVSVNAQVVLKERLATAGWKSGAFVLGNVNLPARSLERTCQTNYVQFGSLTDTVDEFFGAIGKASVKVAVVGNVAPSANKKHVFNITKLGVYLRDTYDFNDDGFFSQPLGVWSKDRCLSKVEMAAYYTDKANRLNPTNWLLPPPYPGFEGVDNSTIREWRKSSGKGGDFVIYSDVVWVDPPIKQVPL